LLFCVEIKKTPMISLHNKSQIVPFDIWCESNQVQWEIEKRTMKTEENWDKLIFFFQANSAFFSLSRFVFVDKWEMMIIRKTIKIYIDKISSSYFAYDWFEEKLTQCRAKVVEIELVTYAMHIYIYIYVKEKNLLHAMPSSQ